MGTRVYIGGLPYRVKERDIERFFRGYGKLREVLIKNGYGFVEFEDYRDADDAVYELNGKELCGERVSVEHARGSGRRGRDDRHDRDRGRGGRGSWDNPPPRYGPPTRTDYRLIVDNLSSRVSWQDLKDYMRQAGEVTYADAHKQHRNEGVVEFASYSDMKTAIEKLDGTELNGRRIKLVEDKETRRGSRRRSRSSSSRSRSRSRSRRRSRSRSKRSGSKSRSRSRSRRSRSKSRDRKSRSRSASKSRSRSRSKSVDRKSRSRSPSKSRSRSKSVDRKSRSRSRDGKSDRQKSPSADRAHRSASKSRSKSPRNSRSKSRSKSPRNSRSKSRSKSPRDSRSKSRSQSPRASKSRSNSMESSHSNADNVAEP